MSDLPSSAAESLVWPYSNVYAIELCLAHVRGIAEEATPDDLDREVELYGRTTTGRRVLLRLLVHLNEHTGQLVAYARSIDVTPPWSR